MNLFIIFFIFLVINFLASYFWTSSNFDITHRYPRVITFSFVAALIGTFIASRGSDTSTFFYYLLNFISGTILFEWDFIAASKFIFIVSIIELVFIMIYSAI